MGDMMAHLIPEQWLSAETSGFEHFLGFTSQYFETLERLTALNLQAVRVGLAESQEHMARTLAAGNLPEMLSLPALLAPASAAHVLSYSRQFFEIMSAMRHHATSRHAASSTLQPRLREGLPGTSATQSRLSEVMMTGIASVEEPTASPARAGQDAAAWAADRTSLRATRVTPIE
jgi:phasin family protein